METFIDFCKNGLPIMLDISTEEIVYKDNRVLVSDAIAAYNSGNDRVKLTETLMFHKLPGIVEFGCLSMSEEKFNQLKNIVCRQLRKKSTILI
jgi:hypothetical protein